MMTEIVKFDPLKAEVAKYKKLNETLAFDYESKDGNAGARSHIFKLRKVKTQITEVHREVKAEALAACQAIDGQKRSLIKDVEDMIDVHAEPLRIIKQKEEQVALDAFKVREAERLAEEARVQKEMEDREAEVARREHEIKVREDTIKAEQERVQREAEQAERDKRVAQEAAERARKEAEAKAVAEFEAVEAAAAKQIADAKAVALAKENTRLAKEADKKREAEIKAANERFEKQQAEAAERRRIENKKHRKYIQDTAWTDLSYHVSDEKQARNLFNAIVAGKIRNVTINY